MIIERIELNHFRNYDQLIITPHAGINIFFGPNGSGKTNLLEGIHYCSLGKSHRINQDLNAVQTGEKGASCRIRIRGKHSGSDLEVRLRPGDENAKYVMIDQKRAARLSEMMGVLRCVIFSPEDLSLMKDGPSVRRKFLDMMISQISRSYFIALQQYRIAMNQRNAVLRQARFENRPVSSVIEDFERAMSEYAEVICRERIRYGALLGEICTENYRKISGREEESFQVQYHPSVRWNPEEAFPMADLLRESREEDLRQGITTLGPQRDDLSLSLNQKSMKLYASQGQMRTGALSLKLAQLMIIERMTGEYPVLLLDDVMSELDLNRRMNLLGMISGVQTFITCSDEGDLSSYQNHRTYSVYSEDGRGQMKILKEGPEEEKPRMKEPVFE